MRAANDTLGSGIRASVPAALLSGLPSTTYALVTRRDPFEATEAAGTLLVRSNAGPVRLRAAGLAAHGVISAFWATVLSATLPREKTVAWGAVAGIAIAMLDLGVIARRFPRIRALPSGPQVADHVAFGVVTALVLERLRQRAA